MNLALNGNSALVCGASQGIGRACAYELARNGATVVALARSVQPLTTLMEELSAISNAPHSFVDVDVNNEVELLTRVKNHVDKDGPITILVNNTGGPAAGPLRESTTDQLIHAFQNHVLVAHQLSKVLLPGMIQQQYGRVINIISTSVKAPLDNLGVSNTIRGAMASWSKTLANEMGPSGVTVNNVLPGATKTQRLEIIIDRYAQRDGISRDEVERSMTNEIPLRRFAEASEIANAVAFLASPAAAYISGTNIVVDGGRTRSF
jgi:3-oxoacyl-[acyl-carrier protein] reductase